MLRARASVLIALAALLLLTACSTTPITVSAPVLELPPIPDRLMLPCEEPPPLQRGTLEDLYLQMIEDAGLWGKCIRNHDRLIELVKYRDSVIAKFRADNVDKPKAAFRWFWQN
jgi:hypothetical protein